MQSSAATYYPRHLILQDLTYLKQQCGAPLCVHIVLSSVYPNNCAFALCCWGCLQALVGSAGVPTVGNVLVQAAKVRRLKIADCGSYLHQGAL